MTLKVVEVEGNLEPDGTLVLPKKLSLPPGRVRVTVQSLSDNTTAQPSSDMTPVEQFWAGMRAIWAGQEARGHVPREKAAIDAEIAAFRDEMEEEMREIEELYREGEAKP